MSLVEYNLIGTKEIIHKQIEGSYLAEDNK